MATADANRPDVAGPGWVLLEDAGYTGVVGPFWRRELEQGVALALRVRRDHLNHNGTAHGGVLLAMADQTLGLSALHVSGGLKQATIQLDFQFLAPAIEGETIVASGEVTRQTRSVVFTRGELRVGDRTVGVATGLWKLLGR